MGRQYSQGPRVVGTWRSAFSDTVICLGLLSPASFLWCYLVLRNSSRSSLFFSGYSLGAPAWIQLAPITDEPQTPISPALTFHPLFRPIFLNVYKICRGGISLQSTTDTSGPDFSISPPRIASAGYLLTAL